MGFYTYIIPSGITLDNINLSKNYFLIDKIKFHYVTVDDKEDIIIVVTINSYNSYEERLERVNLLSSLDFSIEKLIDKKFSENLWVKCYGKIKELILDTNTKHLKEALSLREMEATKTLESDEDNTIIVDTIPNEYQYLLGIEDHFN
tara:strand:+ start:63 stop:503 length:441 start_codon:yes stop_codon:yes gene_type:complete